MLSDNVAILQAAAKDMEQYGAISEKTITSLLTDFPELNKYITQTTNGWTLNNDALDEYLNTFMAKYLKVLYEAEEGTEAYNNAYQTMYNLLSVISTLKLADQINSETEALKKQKEILEQEKDQYKELIELRKKALQTMKDEDDYNKQLAKKQSSVARLRTQLALARLDTSEAGRARARELQEKLSEAEEDLEDFTLSHAVDVITQALDDQYNEYEKMMDNRLKSIDEQISNVANIIQKSSKSIEDLLKNYIDTYVAPLETSGTDIDKYIPIEDFIKSPAFRSLIIGVQEVIYDDVKKYPSSRNAPLLEANITIKADISDVESAANKAAKIIEEKTEEALRRAVMKEGPGSGSSQAFYVNK